MFSLYHDITAFVHAVEPTGSLLCLDIGKSRIGVARSDPNRRVAVGVTLIQHRSFADSINRIETLIVQERIAGLVAGYPLQMDGTPGESCLSIDKFLEKLSVRISLPVLLQDERFSTRAVHRAYEEAGLKRKEKHAKDDIGAAIYILQTALDRLQASSNRQY